MRERSAKKNSYGKIRNGRTNINMEGQRSNTGDEGETSKSVGVMNGARKRGRPRQRWVDTLKGYASGATISDMRRDARERAGWRGATTAVARGRMRLDGTR